MMVNDNSHWINEDFGEKEDCSNAKQSAPNSVGRKIRVTQASILERSIRRLNGIAKASKQSVGCFLLCFFFPNNFFHYFSEFDIVLLQKYLKPIQICISLV
jgi:hypothetical protein